ncbi:secondary thiamine-phosphate synthase enzyme YjbQ [Methanococcoides sp. NM1]|uniref:secondary thiamine-phosphate synthase enzyme YjbQ n=1 Tax=Methanococcoides sp. NM1 TaxID=1201013 RepID=UPI001083C65A|nr:secondary thiamine-phosphate synthase enzyme YjbQ [Methanococcoides sp. NM1]
MPVLTRYLEYDTKGNSEIIDITDDVIRSVSGSGINNGIVTVFAAGSTVAVTTLEYEPGLIHDLQQALERIAPKDIEYKHNERWHDGNGHSHVRASLLGQSESFPLIDGSMLLGTWQQVIFIDLDNRARSRKLVVQIVGE